MVYRLAGHAADERQVRDDSPHPPDRRVEVRRLEGLSKVSVAAAFFLCAKALVLGQSTFWKIVRSVLHPEIVRSVLRPENILSCV